MTTASIYALSSVIIVSLVALLSILALSLSKKILNKLLILLVSFSAGGLLGGAFFHLLPEAVEEQGFATSVSIYILLGILISFGIEKMIHWRHCHNPEHIENKIHGFAFMNLFGDGIHNFIDGLVIGASYLVSIPTGIATTIAVILHEIPQEIGDFGVLLHGGFTRKKAIFYNFLTALTAILGVVLALIIGGQNEKLFQVLIPFAAGSFIYIAAADLMPELHKTRTIGKSIGQLLLIILGIAMVGSILFLE